MALEALIECNFSDVGSYSADLSQNAIKALRAALTLTAERKPFTAAQRERLYMEADANIFHSMTLAAFHRVVQYVEAAQ